LTHRSEINKSALLRPCLIPTDPGLFYEQMMETYASAGVCATCYELPASPDLVPPHVVRGRTSMFPDNVRMGHGGSVREDTLYNRTVLIFSEDGDTGHAGTCTCGTPTQQVHPVSTQHGSQSPSSSSHTVQHAACNHTVRVQA
jgi:hypothetical protein